MVTNSEIHSLLLTRGELILLVDAVRPLTKCFRAVNNSLL